MIKKMTNTYKMHNGWESFNTRTIGQNQPAATAFFTYSAVAAIIHVIFDCYDYTLQQNSNMSVFLR